MQYIKNSRHSVLNDSIVADIRLMNLRGENTADIANKTGVHRKTVYNILKGNTWAHVPLPVRAYGYPEYLVFHDGRVYSSASDKFITPVTRANGEKSMRIKNNKGQRVSTPVSTLVARGYHGTRAQSPKIKYRDGNPSNTHFTNIQL